MFIVWCITFSSSSHIEKLISYPEHLKAIEKVDGIKDPNRIKESEKIFSERWQGLWKEEIVCDLIAGYCIGRPYAWINLKLCQHLPLDMSSGIYNHTETHPPDAYRMKAILIMLKKLGLETEDIRNTWINYAKIFYPNKPPLYDCY